MRVPDRCTHVFSVLFPGCGAYGLQIIGETDIMGYPDKGVKCNEVSVLSE